MSGALGFCALPALFGLDSARLALAGRSQASHVNPSTHLELPTLHAQVSSSSWEGLTREEQLAVQEDCHVSEFM